MKDKQESGQFDLDQYFDLSDLVRLLKISKSTIRRRIKDGVLPCQEKANWCKGKSLWRRDLILAVLFGDQSQNDIAENNRDASNSGCSSLQQQTTTVQDETNPPSCNDALPESTLCIPPCLIPFEQKVLNKLRTVRAEHQQEILDEVEYNFRHKRIKTTAIGFFLTLVRKSIAGQFEVSHGSVIKLERDNRFVIVKDNIEKKSKVRVNSEKTDEARKRIKEIFSRKNNLSPKKY